MLDVGCSTHFAAAAFCILPSAFCIPQFVRLATAADSLGNPADPSADSNTRVGNDAMPFRPKIQRTKPVIETRSETG
jgi:hypothetical protein